MRRFPRMSHYNWLLSEKIIDLTLHSPGTENIKTTAGTIRYKDWCEAEMARYNKVPGRDVQMNWLNGECWLSGKGYVPVDLGKDGKPLTPKKK